MTSKLTKDGIYFYDENGLFLAILGPPNKTIKRLLKVIEANLGERNAN